MDDQASQNNPIDDTKTDETQTKIDEALNKLPNDLEKPVSPSAAAPPPPLSPSSPPVSPTTPPPAVHPAPPPTSPSPPPPPPPPVPPADEPKPEVKPEKPEEIKPPSKLKKAGRGLKKNGVKVVGGVLMLALMVAGGISGIKEIRTRQIINKNARECQTICYPNKWGEECYPVCSADGETPVRTVSENSLWAIEGYAEVGAELEPTRVEEFDPDDYTNCPSNAAGVTCSGYKHAEKNDETRSVKNSSSGAIPSSGNCEVWTGSDGNRDGEIDQEDVRAGDATMTIMPCTEAAKITDPCRQVDWAGGGYSTHIEYAKCSSPPKENGGPDPTPPPSTPPPPTPPASPSPGCTESCTTTAECTGSLECLDVGSGNMCLNPSCTAETDCVCPDALCDSLTGGSGATHGTTETFTCSASFSATSPVAYFHHSVNDTMIATSSAVAIDSTTNQATYDITLDQYGDWEVQCKVCTDSTASSCTSWGDAN